MQAYLDQRKTAETHEGPIVKLVIHIGMPKTGTSTIQRSLHSEESSLEANDIVFPIPPKIGHAHTHLMVLDKKNPIPSFLTQIYGNAPEELTRTGQRILSNVEAMTQNSPANICVLSSEAWFFRPYLFQEDVLSAFIDRNFDSVKFICYTRRPSSYFLSALQQSLKSSPDLIPISPPNFRSVIEMCEEVAPVDCASFEGAVQRKGNIYFDFLRRVGAKPPFKAVEIDRNHENRTFSAEAMILLWEYRRYMPHARRLLRTTEDRQFQSQLRLAEEQVGCAGQRPSLKPEYVALLDRRSPDLEYLQKRFGIDYASSTSVTDAAQSAQRAAKTVKDVIDFDEGLLSELREAISSRYEIELF